MCMASNVCSVNNCGDEAPLGLFTNIYSDDTWESRRSSSRADRLFLKQVVRAKLKENIKVPHYRPFVGNPPLSTMLPLRRASNVRVRVQIIYILTFLTDLCWIDVRVELVVGVKYTVHNRRWCTPQIAKLMGPTWGPHGSCRPQMGPMLAPWTLLSGTLCALLCTVGLWTYHAKSLHWHWEII